MDRNDAFEIVKAAVVEVLQVDAGAVTETTSFQDDFDADSLDLVELVMELEERFEISVAEEDLEGITTVGAAVDLVLAKVSAAA